jgi:glycosyltransferase involved in cell wall biosynthesis
MCNALAQEGNEVTLLVTNRPTHILETPEDFYGTSLLFSVVRVAVPDIAGNIDKVPNFLRPFSYTLQRIVLVIRAWRFIKKESFEYIYGRDQWLLALLSYGVDTPIVWESHEAKYSFVAKRLLYCCKKIVVISEGIQAFYLNKGVPTLKIFVAHDAVDDSFFEPPLSKQEARRVLGIVTDKPVAMYIGGLDHWKGVDTLFEASENNFEKFSTYVIGGGQSDLKSYKVRYPHVHFLGARPYKELKDHQQAADILVIPNTAKNKLSAEYTSPLKLFAHMTSKIPIVVSDIPSIKNVVPEECAYFFEADNPESLTQAIVKVVDNPTLARERSERLYKVSRKYTWRERARGIVKFINS